MNTGTRGHCGRFHLLHIVHGQSSAGDGIILELPGRAQESCGLVFQYRHADVFCFTLDFKERCRVLQFVFCDDVDFTLALAVPPSAYACIGVTLDQHTVRWRQSLHPVEIKFTAGGGKVYVQ